MGEERKIPRLGAAAKEFNVGTSTIVEILKKNGIEIEDNRNVKLTADMYDILQKKLSGEKKVKEESQKIDMDFSHSKTGAKVEAESKTTDTVEEEPAETILVKGNTIEKETVKIEIAKPKVVGKIDLDTPKKSKGGTCRRASGGRDTHRTSGSGSSCTRGRTGETQHQRSSRGRRN